MSGERASSRSIARATPSPRGIFPLPYLPHRHPSCPPWSPSSVDCYFIGRGGEWGNAIDGMAHRRVSLLALPPSLAARARLTIARRFLHDRRRKLIVALRKGGGRGARTGHRRAPSFVISSPHSPPSPCHRPPLSLPHMLPSLTSPLPFESGSRL